MNFGSGTFTSAGDADIFLAKFDPSGGYLWSKSFGSTGFDSGDVLATDASGNVYLAGTFCGSVNFGGGTLTSAGTRDIFLAKNDANGNHQWSKRFGSATSSESMGNLTIDASGNILITGYFGEEGVSINFGGEEDLTSTGIHNIFLVKFDTNGDHLWSKRFGGVSLDEGTGIAVDSSGNIFVTGNFVGPVDFGGGKFTGAVGSNIFLAKYDPEGMHIWSKYFGSGHFFEIILAIDPSGNVIMGGSFTDSDLNLGGETLTNAGLYDIYLAKYDANGNYLWSKGLGSSGDDELQGIAADASGNVIITGSFEDFVVFGGSRRFSQGSADVFLAKYTESGTYLWVKGFGGTDYDAGLSLDIDSLNNIYLTGNFYSSTLSGFRSGPLVNAGQIDIFLARFRFFYVYLPFTVQN